MSDEHIAEHHKENFERVLVWRPILTFSKPEVEAFAIICGKFIDDADNEAPTVLEGLWDGNTWRAPYVGYKEVIASHWMELPTRPFAEAAK